MLTLDDFNEGAQYAVTNAIRHCKRSLSWSEEQTLRTQAALAAIEAYAQYQRLLFGPLTLVVDEQTARRFFPPMQQDCGDDRNG